MSPRWNWDSPTPSLASKCAPPPRTNGGVPIPTTGEKKSANQGSYVKLVGFGHACAPVRCAHPSFWIH